MTGDDGAAPTRVASIDGVVQVRCGDGAQLKLAGADELMTQIVRAAGEGRIAVLLDISAIDAMSRAARRVFSGALGAEHIAALALVVRTEVSRMIASFIVGLGDPPYPLRVFDDHQQGMAWLKEAARARIEAEPGAAGRAGGEGA